MPEYRIYHLDRAGRVSSADWLDADGDQAAIGAARDCNTLQCELWQGRRLVTKLAAGAAPSVANAQPRDRATAACCVLASAGRLPSLK